MMAVESDQITADVIEVNEYPHVAQRYQVYAVPKTVINDKIQFEGARPEESFVSAIESLMTQPNGNAPEQADAGQ